MSGESPNRSAVRERLARVHDPELDRSITDLEYVEELRIDGGHVTVRFVLPTAWCSPPFAWMMATGIRDEVRALPGVTEVTVDLLDHMHAEEINRGVNRNLPFEAVFEDADDGVEEIRRDLDEKARLARQHTAVEALLDAGLDVDQVVTLAPADLSLSTEPATVVLRDGAVVVSVPAEPLRRYLEKARAVEVVTGPDDRLFADADGEPVSPEAFESVHDRARAAKVNIEGQGSICAELHEARNGVTVELD